MSDTPWRSVGAVGLVICDEVGCSQRQLERWARVGLLGSDMVGHGSGTRRPWSMRHAEIAWALRCLSDFDPVRGFPLELCLEAAALLRARPVLPAGEILVVFADGTAWRGDHWCARPDELVQTAAVVPLRSFSPVVPAAGGTGPAVPTPVGPPLSS